MALAGLTALPLFMITGLLTALTGLAGCSRAPAQAAAPRTQDSATFRSRPSLPVAGSPRTGAGSPEEGAGTGASSRAAASDTPPPPPALAAQASAANQVGQAAGAGRPSAAPATVGAGSPGSRPLPAAFGGPESPDGPRPQVPPGEPPFVGVILARQAINVATETDGRIASVLVHVGDQVSRGTPLATLATEDLVQERAMAQAGVRGAEAEERRASLELDRAHDRRARRDIHPELYAQEEVQSAHTGEDEAKADLESARSKVSQERAHLGELDARLTHSVVRAPIDGRIALRYLDPGAMVHAGTQVVRLISSHDFLLRFAVSPERANLLHAGREVEVKLDLLPVTIPGRVTHVAPQIDPASQLVFVEADLAAPPSWAARLQDGLVGRVTPRG